MLRFEQIILHPADCIMKCMLFTLYLIPIKIALDCVHSCPINKGIVSVKVYTRYATGEKLLCEINMTQFTNAHVSYQGALSRIGFPTKNCCLIYLILITMEVK